MTVEDFLGHLEGMVDRKLLRRVAAILFHRRAGFSANGMGVWRVPEDKILGVGGQMAAVRESPTVTSAHLRGLALFGVHDGARSLQGGVRRGPRHIADDTSSTARSRGPLLLDQFKKIRLHYFTEYAAWERNFFAPTR